MSLINKLNYYGKNKIPFFFIISYDLSSYEVIPIKNIPDDILFNINQNNNINKKKKLCIDKPKYSEYSRDIATEAVVTNIIIGHVIC